MTEQLDVMKWLCKDFWGEVFRKGIDNLRTNHRREGGRQQRRGAPPPPTHTYTCSSLALLLLLARAGGRMCFATPSSAGCCG